MGANFQKSFTTGERTRGARKPLINSRLEWWKWRELNPDLVAPQKPSKALTMLVSIGLFSISIKPYHTFDHAPREIFHSEIFRNEKEGKPVRGAKI
jgi:hypothetical protein